jgi:hypothetical protein
VSAQAHLNYVNGTVYGVRESRGLSRQLATDGHVFHWNAIGYAHEVALETSEDIERILLTCQFGDPGRNVRSSSTTSMTQQLRHREVQPFFSFLITQLQEGTPQQFGPVES